MDAAPAPPAAPSGRPPLGRPLAGFALDLLLAGVLVAAATAAGMAAWVLLRGLSPAAAAGVTGLPGPLAQVAIGLGATAFAAWAVYRWRGRASAQERLHSRRAARQPATWRWAVAIGIAVFVFSATVAWLGRHLGIEPEPTNLALIDALVARPWAVLLVAGVLAPLYEELLFRRVLFGRLWRAGRPWLGLVLSSAVFALVHELPGISHNPWPALAMLWLVYGAMGAAFAWVYWRTGTLWAPIAAHAINNLLASAVLLSGAG